jgi:hypothetical protein
MNVGNTGIDKARAVRKDVDSKTVGAHNMVESL